jgi:hypothetical protein
MYVRVHTEVSCGHNDQFIESEMVAGRVDSLVGSRHVWNSRLLYGSGQFVIHPPLNRKQQAGLFELCDMLRCVNHAVAI